MGGRGSGRRPDPMKQFQPQRTSIAQNTNTVGGSFELPNLSGVQPGIERGDIRIALNDLSNVDTSPSDNDVLTFDTASGLWEAQAAAGGFADPMTTRGDIIIRDAANATERLGIGGATEVLTSDGTDIAWAAAAGANHNILDGSVHQDSVADAVTRGSLIYGNATPKWDELVIGADNTFLASDGTDASWAQVKLNELANPDGNTAFTMTTRQIKFTFTNPAVGDGAFEVEASGAFSGDLIHVHQHTGNPGAVDLIHAEADDADVTCLRLDSNGGVALDITSGKMEFTPGTASEILSLNASKELTSLAVATYPSLTELSYVKGATSALQTQITANTTHAADNSQAHTDYLINNGNDTTSGTLTMATASVIGNLTLGNGSIVDSSGAISFNDENLSTSGTLASGVLTVTGNASWTGTATTTGDNTAVDTAYVPMVLFNTDAAPPAAAGFPKGTIYVQYTA